MNVTLLKSYCTRISNASGLKKNKETIDLLTDINILLMVGKDIRGGICHEIH